MYADRATGKTDGNSSIWTTPLRLSEKSFQLSTHRPNLYCQKLESLTYNFAAHSIGLYSFQFLCWTLKHALSFLQHSVYRPFKVIQGWWFWCHAKARMRLPIAQQTLVLSFTVYEIWQLWLKVADFGLHSHLTLPLWMFPLEVRGQVCNHKDTRIVGYPPTWS